METFLFDSIVAEGTQSRVKMFPLAPLKVGAIIRQGSAFFLLDPEIQCPVVSGVIHGVINYEADGLWHTRRFTYPASFILSELPRSEGEITVSCEVVEFCWTGLIAHIHILFHWSCLQKKEISCVTRETPNSIKVKALRIIGQVNQDFHSFYSLPFPGGRIWEMSVRVQKKKERPTPKGIMLSTILLVEAFYENAAGREAWNQWEINWDEWVGADLSGGCFIAEELCSILQVTVEKYQVSEEVVQVDLSLVYQCLRGEPLIANLLTDDNAACKIKADILTGVKKFSCHGRTRLTLRHHPLQIGHVSGDVSSLEFTSHAGWLHGRGRLNVDVAYCDTGQQQRMDSFCLEFAEDWIWEEIHPGTRIKGDGRVTFEAYTINHTQLVYQFLLELCTEALESRILKIMTDNLHGELTIAPSRERTDPQTPLFENPRILLEQVFPLRHKRVSEIASSRTFLRGFRSRSAGNALMVEGCLHGEITYWDQRGFYRREVVKRRFWQFVHIGRSEDLSALSWWPVIRESNCQALHVRPWERGKVRLTLEILLQKEGMTDGEHADFDAKPDGTTAGDCRGYDPGGPDPRNFAPPPSGSGFQQLL